LVASGKVSSDPQRQGEDLSDAAHGFLFQHHAEFAVGVDELVTASR
jgi:hypothetical protein